MDTNISIEIEKTLPQARDCDINAIIKLIRLYAQVKDHLNIDFWASILFDHPVYDSLDNYNDYIISLKVEIGFYYKISRRGKPLAKDDVAKQMIELHDHNNELSNEFALKMYESIKDYHNPKAERVCGLIHMRRKNYEKAYEYMILAIEHGYYACIDAAAYCLIQMGKPELANHFNEIGMNNFDDTQCTFNYAYNLFVGRGCQKNEIKAIEIYERLRKIKDNTIQPKVYRELILAYGSSDNYFHDYAKTYNYAREYEELGYLEGKAFKGYCIANGLGIGKNPEIGWAMVSYAASKGDELAKEMLASKAGETVGNKITEVVGDSIAKGIISIFG